MAAARASVLSLLLVLAATVAGSQSVLPSSPLKVAGELASQPVPESQVPLEASDSILQPHQPRHSAPSNTIVTSGDDHPSSAALQTKPTHLNAEGEGAPRVQVGDIGNATGTILRSFKGRPFYAFMSLPYAEPPVGNLRFKYPVPLKGPLQSDLENGDYDATYLRARCPQNSMILSVVTGREDCLHVSVYTPLLLEDLPTGSAGLPVMVWVHGGAYTSGDGSLYVPTKLMDRDVLVVVVQYRLGSLGFMAGMIEDNPGNMGLMDQIEALRWVQTYIEHFGGDPNLVTVFGQSAGGASASWMQVTPLTNETHNGGRQLLHRVVPQSGSALEVWTLDYDPEGSFRLVATEMGCWDSGSTTQEMVACMRDLPFQDVIHAGNKIAKEDLKAGGLGFLGLCPVVQTPMGNLELVVPKRPREAFLQGEYLRVPLMSGSVRDEGSLVLGIAYNGFMAPNNHTTDDEEFLRDDVIHLLLNAFGIQDENAAVGSSMQLAYLSGASMGDWDSMVGGLVDMTGVMFLKSGLWEAARFTRQQQDQVFFYSWEFDAQDDSLFNWMFIASPDLPVPGGIGHADELVYLFHLPLDADDRQSLMVDRAVRAWTNFAKYGDPTPAEVDDPADAWDGERWKPYSPEEPNFMLVQDEWTVGLDYTTRWTFHSGPQNQPSTERPGTTPPPDTVPLAQYDQLESQKQSFQIATGLLAGLAGCACFLAAVVAVKSRKNRNRIV